jgi:hypothetical protein
MSSFRFCCRAWWLGEWVVNAFRFFFIISSIVTITTALSQATRRARGAEEEEEVFACLAGALYAVFFSVLSQLRNYRRRRTASARNSHPGLAAPTPESSYCC